MKTLQNSLKGVACTVSSRICRWGSHLTREGIILKDDLVGDSTARFPEPNTVLGSKGGQKVVDLRVDDLGQVLLALNLCLDEMVAVDGGRYDILTF